ncbi:MAG TPA: putative metal-binding motif-containing protein, partial [Polyangia bacterium]|nr:putative metal-binding motif-containing protein [Polyangia bacterium]
QLRVRALVLALAFAGGGCGPSGVRVDAHATFELRALVLYGAVSDAKGRFVIDPRLDGRRVDVSGRNLRTSPYQIFMQEDDGAPAGAQVVVAVIGRRDVSGSETDVAFGELAPPQAFRDGDIVIRQVELAEFTSPPYASRDTNCLRVNGGIALGSRSDHDCDGYKNFASGGNDCDDEDPNVHPGAPEICGNGKDDNCNGVVDEDVDMDQDGYTTCTGHDCDDSDPTVHPGAPEICDGKDNDCDGHCDEPFDADGDHYTTCGSLLNSGGQCVAPPLASRVDCDDNDAAVHPNATEVCNGRDDNCNGMCDEGFDADGDKYTTCGTRTDMCMAPNPALVDCRDMDPLIHPGAPEVCDGYDDNCDGVYAGAAEFCFTMAGANCSPGRRPCNDMTPPGFTGSCTALSDLAPAEYCTAYAACDGMAAVRDKLGCTGDRVPARIFQCDLDFSAAGLCPNAQLVLPGPGTGTCSWTMDGATVRDGYTLGILDTMGMPQTTSASCMPAFGVTAFGGASGSEAPSAAFLQLTVNATMMSRVAVLLAPITVASCPASGVQCR